MELYSYEGEKLASSYYSSYLGGDFLDKDEYPCNNRQIRVDFEKAESPSDKYFVPGEILLNIRTSMLDMEMILSVFCIVRQMQ